MPRKFFRRLCLLAVVAALLVAGLARAPQVSRAASGSGSSSGSDGADSYVPNEVNIKLFHATDLQAVAQQFGLQLIEQFGSRPIYRMHFPEVKDAKVKAAEVAADARVQFAEANFNSGAPEAKIMPLRVLDPQGVGNNWVLMEAIAYALDTDGDPSTDDGADVINMSLATVHQSDILRQFVGEACDDKKIENEDPNPITPPAHPVVVVVAAGNNGTEQKMYPAAENAAGEISVGASGTDDTVWSLSERGWPKVMAPGDGIISSVPNKGTGVWSGTSMASPLVAGVAALVRASSPTLTPTDVTERIREQSARPQNQPIDRRVDAALTDVPFPTGTANPIDSTPDYVRENYLDFLNRAPDSSGFQFWQNEITGCGASAGCVEVKRINVSGAFFLSIEFQNTGYFVYRMYKAAYGNLTGAPVPVAYEDFMPDTQKVGEGIVVGPAGWELKLEASKNSFALDIVNRSQFTRAGSLTPQLSPGA